MNNAGGLCRQKTCFTVKPMLPFSTKKTLVLGKLMANLTMPRKKNRKRTAAGHGSNERKVPLNNLTTSLQRKSDLYQELLSVLASKEGNKEGNTKYRLHTSKQNFLYMATMPQTT